MGKLYENLKQEMPSPECADWLEGGRAYLSGELKGFFHLTVPFWPPQQNFHQLIYFVSRDDRATDSD